MSSDKMTTEELRKVAQHNVAQARGFVALIKKHPQGEDNDLAVMSFEKQEAEWAAVLALISERDQLEAMVDGFWWYLDQAYNIESREELEVIAEGWEPSNPMQVAIHHIWKREPKVVELDAKLAAAEERMAAMEGALKECRGIVVGFGKNWNSLCGHYDLGPSEVESPLLSVIDAALDGTTD